MYLFYRGVLLALPLLSDGNRVGSPFDSELVRMEIVAKAESDKNVRDK